MTADQRREAFHPKPGEVHASALEAMRDAAAPIGSTWRSKVTGEVWILRRRQGNSVVLQNDEQHRAIRGALAVLLKNYIKENAPCAS